MKARFAAVAMCCVAWAGASVVISRCAAAQQQVRDGQRDFDFEIGNWRTHIRRLAKPLTGSKEWVEYDGTSRVTKLWDGRANMVELDVAGPGGHIEGISLRVYMPKAHQWSLNYASRGSGELGVPTVGEFRNGRGEFYDQEDFGGRTILVRNVWKDITADAGTFEQSFSEDGGKTWEVNWVANDTRVKDEAEWAKLTGGKYNVDELAPPAASGDTRPPGQRDFDFELGSWNIHLKKLMNAGATGAAPQWVEFDGTSVTRSIWSARAQIEQFETADPVSHQKIEGITLRLWDAAGKQWRLYWWNSADGIGEAPTIGEVKDGRGDFYNQEVRDSRALFVRYEWTKMETGVPHFEQSFSWDGGKTWEVNWITDQRKR